MTRSRTAPTVFSLLCVAGVVGAGLHTPTAATTLKCPAPYALAELHAVGQRFEAGIPAKGETPQVVVQHGLTIDGTQASTNGNYIVFLACARSWNKSEQDAANANLSTGPVNFPFVIAK